MTGYTPPPLIKATNQPKEKIVTTRTEAYDKAIAALQHAKKNDLNFLFLGDANAIYSYLYRHGSNVHLVF